jgi:MFS family permease
MEDLMGILKSLNREQREAVGLLQIGTFLEYFDLMLYVHMAVLLNELFFPKTDPHTAALVTAFAFCSTYVLRPFGALFFGWLGDNIGRKSTVIITTMMMSFSCIVMATLPTYAQIGIAASWIVTFCRMVQGLSSMGEIVGAEIYLTESIKEPQSYTAVSLISVSSALGTMGALGVASLVTRSGFDWRVAFWIGAGIAVVGSVARTRLRETPEFLEMKKRKKELVGSIENVLVKGSKLRKNLVNYFYADCSCALMFYLAFIFFTPILQELGCSSQDIILQNFILSIFSVVCYLTLVYLSTFVHPLKVLNFRSKFYFLMVLLLPVLITQCRSRYYVFFLQILLVVAGGGSIPADPIFIKSIKIEKRVTLLTLKYAFSRIVTHIGSAFGLIYLMKVFGYWGLWGIALPVSCAYILAVRHFERLEGLRPDKPTPIKEETVLGKAA